MNLLSSFYKMANDVYGVLFSNVHPVSGETYQSPVPDDESFLRNVITPLYGVLRRVNIILLHLHTFFILFIYIFLAEN